MKTIKVNFLNENNEQLFGKLDMPISSKPRTFALFAHCFTCSKDLLAVGNISLALTQQGIAVLRFDFTGLGQSDGDFADTNFSSNISDLVSAYNFLNENYDAPQILIGHSLGGAAVLYSAEHMPKVNSVVTIGAPSNPEHVSHLLENNKEQIESAGQAVVNLGGRPFTIKKQFLDDLEANSCLSKASKLNKALLILHSPQDTTVGVENAAQIYQAAKHPKSFISLDGADHLLNNKEDSLYAGQMIASWANKYITANVAQILETDKQAVVRTGENGYTTEIRVGEHALIADEPTSVGGADLGPSPYGFLLASLGACTSMTLRMYADIKKWDLKEVTVHLSHEKAHNQDCSDCDNKSSKIDKIDRVIELEGNLDDTQRTRLLEIADRCPVHKTLHSTVKVDTVLK
jgi:uncharacterized OsmC-like protein/alpha/beta superfamily hydrolase